MTDNELKFFDPETGAELHRVPEGATIPRLTPHGYIRGGERRWRSRGLTANLPQEDDIPRFTREPIAPPTPLPTEPGYYTDEDGDLWHVNDSGERVILLVEGLPLVGVHSSWVDDDRNYGPFTPVTLVPTETWDRLRVLDPEDTRDRIGADNTRWRWAEGAWRRVCDSDCRIAISSLEGLSDWYGPLRFADEASDR